MWYFICYNKAENKEVEVFGYDLCDAFRRCGINGEGYKMTFAEYID